MPYPDLVVESQYVSRAQVFNTALPSANTNLLAADVTPKSPSGTLFRIYAAFSIAGNLILRRTRTPPGTTTSETLGAMTANVAQNFEVIVDSNETINLQLSTTTGNTLKLAVAERSTFP